MSRWAAPPWGAILAASFLLLTVAVPLAMLLGPGVARSESAGRLGATILDPVTGRAIENSAVQGTLAAAGALLLGVPAGLALGRYDFRGRNLVRGLLLVPFLLPALSMVVAVTRLFGSDGLLSGPWPGLRPLGHGLLGVVFVDVLYNAPLVALLTTVGVESSSRELEETVRTLGGPPGRAFRDAWGAPALTGAAAGGVLTFALSALAFAAPIALGGPSNYTVEARVWSLDQVLADPSAASVVAAVAVALLAIPIAAYFLLLRRLAPRSGSVGRPPGPIARDDRSAWVLLGGLGMLGAIEAMVIGAVLMGLFDPASPGLGHDGAVGALFSPSVSAKLGLPLPEVLANSAVFSGLAASLALLLGLGLASGARGRGRWPADLLTVAPIGLLVVSPVVLALSLLTAGGPWVGASGIWILIVLGQALLALPFVAQSLGVALARVPANLREAAQSLGSSPGAAYLEVELPAARAGIAAAGLLAVALCIGEFTATYFLAIPRFTTATVALYRLTDARLVPEAGALAALLVLLSAGLLALASSGGRRVAL